MPFLKIYRAAFSFFCKCFIISLMALYCLPSKAQCSFGIMASNSPLNCNTSTTSATITVPAGSGTPPFTYTWLPTGGNFSVATNLSPNTYTILATDFNGCQANTQLVIYNGSSIFVNLSQTDPTCPGSNDGKIIAMVSGAFNPPLTYSWTPAAPNTATLNNLSAGNYTLTVGDASNCFSAIKVAALVPPPPISVTIATKTLACNGDLSNAAAYVSGGTSPYTYSWSPTAGSGTAIIGVPAGTYSVSITDSKNCQHTESVTITQPPSIVSNLSVINILCNGDSTGAAFTSPTGGTPGYTCTWLPLNTNTTSINHLTAGSYTLNIKDTRSCLLSHTFSVTQPAPLLYNITHQDEFCVNADGTATISLTGGTSPYTYSWTTSPVQTGSVASGLVAGSYSVHISDAASCTVQAAVTIGNVSNLAPKISSFTNVNCNGSCSGSATAGINGGSPPFSYNWLSIPSATNAMVNNLCAGQYTVKITDALGCYTYTSVTITEPPAMTQTITGTNLICSGQNAVLSASVSGGKPNYLYHWQPGNLSGPTVTVAPVLTTGYSLTVTDANGCNSAANIFTVAVNAPLAFNTGANSLTVCPNVNASVSVFPTGGDGNYSYTWLPGNVTTQSLSVNLQSSTVYTVTVSDGCGTTPISSTVNVTIYQTQVPSFTYNGNKGCEPLCVQFNNTSTGTTTALWTFGDFSPPIQSPVVTHCYKKAGTYTVVLTTTDIHGCKAILKVNDLVKVYPTPVADFVHYPEVIDLNTPDVLFKNSAVNASQFQWIMDGIKVSSSSEFQHTFFEVGCHNLKLIASNINACTDTTEREICVTEGFNFYAPNAFTPDEDDKNEVFIPKGTGWSEEGYHFEILDRWGATVFQTSDINEGWNGKYRGSPATDDVYVWRIALIDVYDHKHTFNGKVMLMR